MQPLLNECFITRVTTTELPSFPLERQFHQLPANEMTGNQNIISSKDEPNGMHESFPEEENSRSKRFLYFLRYVSTATSISYSFVSTTITKAVNLISSFGISQLICMPQGYVLCT